MGTFERFVMGLTAVVVLSYVVEACSGCGGAPFVDVGTMQALDEPGAEGGASDEAGGGGDGNLRDGGGRRLPDADGALPDAAAPDAPRATDGGQASCDAALQACWADDPGPGSPCHTAGGVWCAALDGGCGPVGSACAVADCPGHVRCP